MSAGGDGPIDARFAHLDAKALIELATSLADYGEAGGLSHDLMVQVGQYAEARHGDDVDVLLAVARMYLFGGEPRRARDVLLQAGGIGQSEARVLSLLSDALALLDDPRGAEQALRDARAYRGAVPPPSSTPPRGTSTPDARRYDKVTPTTPIRRRDVLEAAMETSPAATRASLPPAAGAPEPPAAGPRAPLEPSIARTTRIRPLDPDDPRRWLDPYELLGEIASGGMATVYLGHLAGHGGFSRLVAIKQLHPHLAHEETFVQMFLDEARLAAGIHHPHVVPILEVGRSKAGYFLVMEFIEGDTLSGLTARSLQRGAILPAPVAARIVLDVLSGLHAAHQLADGEGRTLGLVHRDCTPQNILVGVDGSARITDFGVARAASRLAITRPHQVKGKVGYLSPEQAHAMDLDRRSDVFTMGIVLWEGLAGRPLFQADTDAATLTRLISAPIPSVRSFVPDVPPEIDEVCRRALHRDRSRRFRTAAEMAEALERAAGSANFPGTATPRELGRFVESTMGADLVAQREAVRAWLIPSPAGPGSAAAVPSRPPGSRRRHSDGGAAAIREDPPASQVDHEPVPPSPPAPEIAGPAAPKAAPVAPEQVDAKAEMPAVADPTPAAKPARSAADPTSIPAAPGTSASARERLAKLTASVASIRPGSPKGIVVMALLIIVGTSPLWLRALIRTLRGPSAPATQVPTPRPKAPAPPLKAQPAWDDGDWALPDAGLETDEPR